MTSADLALVSCSDTLAGSLARRQLTQRRKRYAVCLAPPGAIPVPERMTAMPRASRPSGIDERVVQLLLNVVRELLRKLRSALGELEGARHFGRTAARCAPPTVVTTSLVRSWTMRSRS